MLDNDAPICVRQKTDTIHLLWLPFVETFLSVTYDCVQQKVYTVLVGMEQAFQPNLMSGWLLGSDNERVKCTQIYKACYQTGEVMQRKLIYCGNKTITTLFSRTTLEKCVRSKGPLLSKQARLKGFIWLVDRLAWRLVDNFFVSNAVRSKKCCM